ncbi:putative two-component sensor histidine kinase [Chlamydiales bacterium STE3]|nr:putative two-component sensor histidine kinase [Chlamydiales bacterium STE3]
MDKSRLENLKKIVREVGSASTTEKQIELLSEGFALFSQETARLDNAYATLKNQFRSVNHKLEETNKRLANKVQELHVLTTYLDNILSNISQGLLFIDFSCNITTYNKAAEAILKIPREKVLFQSFHDFFPDHFFGFSMRDVFKKNNPPKSAFTTVTFPDGTQKELEIANTFIPPKNKRDHELDFTEGLIILIRDITEIRQLQVNANRVDRMKELGEMAAQVAHEIRNPLGGIKGFASLLQRDLANNPEMQNLANYIVEGTDTLDRLVANVLNYARPLQLHFEAVEMNRFLEDLKKSILSDSSVSKKLHFTIKTPTPSFYLSIDAGLFRGALLNLVINSLQAMPKGGKLNLELSEKNHKACIKISDTGCGISEENLKKIFNPFFTTKPTGNGLGLAETLKVIQAHGGEVEVDSTVGLGTTFTIKVPLKM